MQIGVDSARAVENKRIFVLESDEITRAALQFMLHDENETHEIPTVAEAYQKAADWKPDIILLGLALVQEHGVGLVGELREKIPGVKILVIAPAATDPTARSCVDAGAQGVLAKPFTIESVRRKVDIVLGRRTSLAIPIQIV